MWTPDSELEHAALETIDAEAAALRINPAAEHASTLLEAVGTLAALNLHKEASQRVVEGVRSFLRDYLQSLELPELDEAGTDLLENASRCLTLDTSVLDEELDSLIEALRTRDRIELLWLGAETLELQRSVSDEANASRYAFDDDVGPVLWQLVRLGALRTTELLWMAPTQRSRFWWRSKGAELPAAALDDLQYRDAVCAIFPEARTHFDALAAHLPDTGVIDLAAKRTLRSLFSKARDEHRQDDRGAVRAAASGGMAATPEVPLLATKDVDASIVGSMLYVDVIGDLQAGQVPKLIGGGMEVSGTVVSGANQRYAFDLTDRELDVEGWRIVVPLVSGTIEVVLDGATE